MMKQPEKDAEGFSLPPSVIDAITEAEREAGLYGNFVHLRDVLTNLDTAYKTKATISPNSNLTSETHLSRKKMLMQTLLRRTWLTLCAR